MKITQSYKYTILLILFCICIFLIKEYIKAIDANELIPRSPLDHQINMHNPDFSVDAKALAATQYRPISFTRTGSGEYSDSCFIEFDKTWFGSFYIVLPNDYLETEIEYRIGEWKDGLSVFKPKNTRNEFVSYYSSSINLQNQASTHAYARLPLRGFELNVLANRTVHGLMPFKYIELTSGCRNLSSDDFFQIAYHYNYGTAESYFVSDDVVLNDIYQLAKHTILATSFMGVFIDGNREIKPYEADSYITQMSQYSINNDRDIARSTQEYLLENGTWPTEWAIHSIFMAYEDYLRTGDKDFLRDNYAVLRARTLIDLARDDFLVSSSNQTQSYLEQAKISAYMIKDLVDWPPQEASSYQRVRLDIISRLRLWIEIFIKSIRLIIIQLTDLNTTAEIYAQDIMNLESSKFIFPRYNSVVNAFHFEALKKMAYIANEIGLKADYYFFKTRVEDFKISFQASFLNEKEGLISDSISGSNFSFHSNLFALRFGLVPIEYKDTVIDFLITSDAGSVYAYQYYLEALYSNGRQHEAYNLLTSLKKRSWHRMITDLDSDMTTESWSFDINPGMDLSHSWGSSPINIITRNIIGVSSQVPNFKEFNIHPKDKDLNFFNSKVPLIDSFLTLNMKRDQYSINYSLEFSGSRVATFYLDVSPCSNYKISKNNVSIENLFSKEGIVIIPKIPSGKYEINMKCLDF